ncbi:cytochrome c oxidase subunit IV [Cytobacillus horneckiae]|uniref:Cytochrome c oxidase subunit IVB n=1 Tax=Cytobacillus horneckiae TaxID=549687 RepID=A0A2N0ZKF7_9BACI|nr:cytochrome c oxidase subunit IVB [Cytobacillus horneckiae]NRG45475.1 cytochrome c oxidase subunit IVB [Bacillus sp. CRN 9]MBN6889172.1 cytochrome c oxidase subunit IVB [Cytobacillus horneckiae]MCM3178390.1 cytochrome c oxidase subunit IVB [Cytobacillus horneckiae]MEC1156871.1 cytochrome c oxidase subunit IVB [Cytobacillus horneckiae]MED2940470.1 cytochrome c oxidase subunit IVB [Cytobacillus horneckiae]
MANEELNSGNPKVDIEYRRKKSAEEMRYQVVSFALMIFLTLVAFVAVGYDGFSAWFIIPFILVLAGVQVAFQLYYFMHMSHKGHEAPALFLYSGVFVAFITLLAFMTIIWW